MPPSSMASQAQDREVGIWLEQYLTNLIAMSDISLQNLNLSSKCPK
jgi:hypothetical protein